MNTVLGRTNCFHSVLPAGLKIWMRLLTLSAANTRRVEPNAIPFGSLNSPTPTLSGSSHRSAQMLLPSGSGVTAITRRIGGPRAIGRT